MPARKFRSSELNGLGDPCDFTDSDLCHTYYPPVLEHKPDIQTKKYLVPVIHWAVAAAIATVALASEANAKDIVNDAE